MPSASPATWSPQPRTFVLNPEPHAAKEARLVDRRLRIFADELDYEHRRLREWAIAHAVMSACWSLEDHGRDWEGVLLTAQMLLDR
jgi:streptomycin 6-kinase